LGVKQAVVCRIESGHRYAAEHMERAYRIVCAALKTDREALQAIRLLAGEDKKHGGTYVNGETNREGLGADK
jgi:hypothetical protein